MFWKMMLFEMYGPRIVQLDTKAINCLNGKLHGDRYTYWGEWNFKIVPRWHIILLGWLIALCQAVNIYSRHDTQLNWWFTKSSDSCLRTSGVFTFQVIDSRAVVSLHAVVSDTGLVRQYTFLIGSQSIGKLELWIDLLVSASIGFNLTSWNGTVWASTMLFPT
jgi:hypothetical protein